MKGYVKYNYYPNTNIFRELYPKGVVVGDKLKVLSPDWLNLVRSIAIGDDNQDPSIIAIIDEILEESTEFLFDLEVVNIVTFIRICSEAMVEDPELSFKNVKHRVVKSVVFGYRLVY